MWTGLVSPYIRPKARNGLRLLQKHGPFPTPLGRVSRFTDEDFEEFLRRVQSGRRPSEVGLDKDMPGYSKWRSFLRAHPDFQMRLDDIFESLPFHIQAKAGMLGKRFNQECSRLFEAGYSDHRIAAELGVTAMTANKRTKPWRGGASEAVVA